VYDFADSGESTAGCASLAWQALGEDAKRKHNAAGLFSRGFKVEDEATFLRVSGTMTGALEKKKIEKHSPCVCVMCAGASATPLQSCAFRQMYHRSTSQNSQARRKWRKSHKLTAETTETQRRVVKMMKVVDDLHPLRAMNCALSGELRNIGHFYLR
jgi:hypothetical protein